MKNENTLLSTNNKSCWLSWLSFVLVTVLSLFQLNAQEIQRRPSDQRIPASTTASDKSLYSSPDILNVPSGYTIQQIQAKINSQYSLAKNGTSIVPNPDLPSSLLCEDLRVIFVLDESGSINSTEANEVRAGAIALANSLLNSGAELRVIEFNTTSSIVNLGGSLVNASFITNLNNYLYGTSGTRYNPISSGSCTGWTNWEDALEDVQTLAGDLVIFFTDGNPTAYNVAVNNGCASGSVTVGSNGSYSATTALNRAIGEANIIKNQGKHMIVAAVGSDLNLQNCKDISGNDDFAVTGSVFTADYIVGEFNSLALDLAAIANSICGTDLVFTKTASALSVCSGEQVTFTLSVTNTGGDYNFAAYNTVITDVFPNGFSNLQILAPVPAGASLSGNTLTYNVGDLAVNQTKSISIKATVNIPPGNFTNTAFAIANNANQQSSSVTVNSGYASEVLNISSCDPYVLNGITYNNTGTYTQELTSAAGCDSILTLNFTRRQATSGSQQASACGSYVWNGNTYTSSGQYSVTLTNAQGCDSTAVLNLTVTPQPPMPETACYQTATFNSTTCSWEITGTQPEAPTGLACYEEANFNTATCAWEVTGEMPAQPSIACYEEANFNTATCSWDVTGEMPAQPATACYEEANFNTTTCAWEVTGEMPAQPSTACYEEANFNTTTCAWEVTGDMPAQPSIACYEEANFNTATCAWEVTGEMPAQPSIACYEEANFNTTTCAWEVTGEMPAQPSIACYEEANFNTATCSWDVTGEMPAQPATACYEEANFNTATCAWEVTGEMPAQPATACYEEANFNTATCAWDVTGEMPAQPAVSCYEYPVFNAEICQWEIIGGQPPMPTLACYEEANFNTTTCSWDVTGEMPAQPATACYEEANFNTTTCSWDVTGEMPAQPATACYEEANFNTATCAWEVTGEMPAQPATACYEEANFNTATCAWEVTGEMPAQPATACYEEANFNTATCSWDVTGEMPAQPATACYEVANFNTTTCAWEVTGEMPAQPATACYEEANFNTATCSWDVTGEMPAQPATACYEEANFNTATCSWDVTGEMPAQPATACYEEANFNTATCSWDVTGEMPAQPAVSCYEYSVFNGEVCQWEIFGGQPPMPTLACYEEANFNTTTCAWEVTGDIPAQPSIACYEEANFNTATCSWDVTGEMPAQPATACYEEANFNTATCAWEVTGEMPAQPATACYEEANFNTTTCSWEVTGEMPAQPATACYEEANFNTATCSWDVTGEMPAQPSIACYEEANFNTTTCAWEVTGEMPAQPATACYEEANFNTATCSWDVTGEMPAQPATACYEEANFNTATCSWDVTGEMPAQPATACYEEANFNTATCSWDVTGEMPAQPSIACYEEANFNTTTCSWDVTGEMPAQPATACYEEANFNTATCSWDVTGEMPEMPVLESYQTATFNPVTCSWDVTGNPPSGCYAVEVFNFSQGLTKLGTAVNAERSNELKALGAPDGQNPAVNAPVQNFVSLGFGGSIELDFGYEIANGPGADIKIWESSASPNMEKAQILVSQDGLGYLPVAVIQQGGEVDFGGVFADYIRFVKIVDVSNLADFSNVQVSDGYDVDAIECIHGRYIIPQTCVGSTVISATQGLRKDGSNVLAVRSDVTKALGAPQVSPVGVVDFYALGFGGEMTIAFDGPVANGPGADIRITETTWNYTCANYPETADVFASQDGMNYVYLGQTCMSNSFDLGALSWAQYIRIVDVSDAALFPADADGYDVNGIECLHPGLQFIPGDDDLTPCAAAEMVSYNPGTTKNGNPVAAIRSNPNNALGAPQSNDTYNFVSLGFGGELVLKYDFVIFNLPGNDIKVIETSFGNPSCPNYPETARISVSMDGVNFSDLGELCLDGTIDLGSVPYAQYVRVTDISNSGSFGGSADGYDVDAVVVLNGPCAMNMARSAEFDNISTPDETIEMSLMPNPATEFTVINLSGTTARTQWIVEVFDAAGRLVNRESFTAAAANSQYFLKLNQLESGIYMVRVSNGEEHFVQRLVK